MKGKPFGSPKPVTLSQPSSTVREVSAPNVNAKADRDVTPLHEAARMGNVEIARLLLKQGADVNAKDSDGKTPLNWISTYKELPEMVNLLCDHGGRESKDKPG